MRQCGVGVDEGHIGLAAELLGHREGFISVFLQHPLNRRLG